MNKDLAASVILGLIIGGAVTAYGITHRTPVDIPLDYGWESKAISTYETEIIQICRDEPEVLTISCGIEIESETYEVLKDWTITYYCPCSKCCGRWANERPADSEGNKIVYTSSGTIAKEGRTIACNSLETGTRVIIGGHEYTVEDTGDLADNQIDIYITDHDRASELGTYKTDIFLHK